MLEHPFSSDRQCQQHISVSRVASLSRKFFDDRMGLRETLFSFRKNRLPDSSMKRVLRVRIMYHETTARVDGPQRAPIVSSSVNSHMDFHFGDGISQIMAMTE